MEYLICIPLVIFIVSVALQVYWHIQEIKIPQKNKLKIKINRYICIFAMSIFFFSLPFIGIFVHTASWTEGEFISYIQNFGIFKIIFQILASVCMVIHISSFLFLFIFGWYLEKLDFYISDNMITDVLLWIILGFVNIGWYVAYWEMLSI